MEARRGAFYERGVRSVSLPAAFKRRSEFGAYDLQLVRAALRAGDRTAVLDPGDDPGDDLFLLRVPAFCGKSQGRAIEGGRLNRSALV